MGLGVGVDIGTSGIRAQALDLEAKKIISTAITLRHPLPGANIMDHLNFAVEAGLEVAHKIVAAAVTQVIRELQIPLNQIERIGVCGNPAQLSIFQGIEFRDLAYAGSRKIEDLGISGLERNSSVVEAGAVGLGVPSEVEVLIPPVVKHEVGADALAMMIKSGFLEREGCALVTDYGTNAEIALKVKDTIYTGSCAAGPAIEGQEIERGMLASPGAISDISYGGGGWRCSVLDQDLTASIQYDIDPETGRILNPNPPNPPPKGITGTGTIGIMAVGLETGLIQRKRPHISTPDRRLHLYEGIYLTENDYAEAGKAFGAFRAGHAALVAAAGITFEDIEAAYMCGAGGTYVDPLKAQAVGLVPATVQEIYQVGNTSLAMADSIALDPEWLDRMQELVGGMRTSHVMFASSNVFKKAYLLELDFWERGMRAEERGRYEKVLKLPSTPAWRVEPKIHRVVARDIPVLGDRGLRVVAGGGGYLVKAFDRCTGCDLCGRACPERALRIVKEGEGWFKAVISTERCNGTACVRCEAACPIATFRLTAMDLALEDRSSA